LPLSPEKSKRQDAASTSQDANENVKPAGDKSRTLILWIAVQAFITLLAGINLISPWTRTPLPFGEFVRWREMFSMLLITPGSVAVVSLVMWTLERGRKDAGGPLALLVMGGCLLGVSMGCHEPMNVLNGAGGPRLAPSLHFWDEIFSHAVFFAAYAAISVALIWSQVRNPLPLPMSKGVALAFILCGIIGGVGIYCTELPAGDITVDLVVIAAVIAVAECLRKGRSFSLLPVNVSMEGAYVLALVALILKRL